MAFVYNCWLFGSGGGRITSILHSSTYNILARLPLCALRLASVEGIQKFSLVQSAIAHFLAAKQRKCHITHVQV